MPPAKRNRKAKGKARRSASPQVIVPADKMDNQQTNNQPAAAAGRRREIPDSQEDPDDAALSDNNQAADLGGYYKEEDKTPAQAKKAVYVSMVSHRFHYMIMCSLSISLLTCTIIGLCCAMRSNAVTGDLRFVVSGSNNLCRLSRQKELAATAV